MNGHIVRRLLVNTMVDPDEAARRLPEQLRPHIVDDGTVVGICLLELSQVRPNGLPTITGRPLTAAAHRVSVEWDTAEGVEVGVFVPIRLTDSRLAALVGGRLVPGVHHRVPLASTLVDGLLAHSVDAAASPFHVDIEVAIEPGAEPLGDDRGDVMATTCLGARIGLSPNRRDGLDAIGMTLEHHRVRRVELERLVSPWLSSFESGGNASAVLLGDAAVRWSPARSPQA